MIKVYNDFLNLSYFQELSDLMCSNEFAWFYQENISRKNSSNINEHGFCHWIVHENSLDDPDNKPMYQDRFMPLLRQIQNCVKKDKIIRARGDMTMVSTERFEHNYHQDFPYDHIASILYMNETDGETIILEDGVKKTVEPEANKLVTFTGTEWHTGCSPLKHKRRILINSNYR